MKQECCKRFGRRFALRTVAAIAVLAAAALARADDAYPWQVGLAKAVITPSESMWMAGYAARKSPSEGTLHDLYAKAAAFKDSQGRRLVIVTLDLIGVPGPISAEVLQGVKQKFQLDPHELLLNASHTHCGPELRENKVYFYGLSEEQGPKIKRYAEQLTGQLVEVVGRALEDFRPARLAVSQDAATFAKNRRFPTGSGFANRPYDDGPVDHEVPVLAVWRPGKGNGQEQLAAVLFGYACHNTTLSIQQFCGDYAGFAQLELEKQLPGTQAMFVMGAGGDQNPDPRRELKLAEQHGASLAQAVQRALQAKPLPVSPTLRSARADAVLHFQPIPPREQLEVDLESKNVYRVRKANYLLDQLKTDSVMETYACPVQAVRLGSEVVLVAIGGEVVVDYSHKLKSRIEAPLVWVAGYSNDVFGYLPSKRVLLEGGYEGGGAMLYGHLPGPFAEDVEDRVLATIDRVLEQTQSQAKQP